MKIDIHVHTKKTKQGDSPDRNIDADRFEEIIKNTEVKILAITNHNHFDLEQYAEFQKRVEGICQIWPGIELDVVENGNRAHLLVIVNPTNAHEFATRIQKLLEGKTADNFTISLEDTVENFDDLDCIFIPHYFIKKPNLDDEAVEKLGNLTSNKKRILKEATNAISAGIYISHGHNSIYGSDVHNWEKYEGNSQNLPELRLPVTSFEQFCLLLEKDDVTIKTMLDSKNQENIVLNPFSAAELIDLNIYNDINIIFGSKGTGKTEILQHLSDYYNAKGLKTEVYKSTEKQLKDIHDLKGNDLKFDVGEYEIDKCEIELERIRNATQVNITSLSKYRQHFSTKETNRISQKIKIKNFAILDESELQRKFREIKEVLTEFYEFNSFIESDDNLQALISEDLFQELVSVLDRIINELKEKSEDRFVAEKSVKLFNSIINIFSSEISKKTGVPEKPTKTGFFEYASNRINIENDIKKINNNINKEIEPKEVYVGSLGAKGELYCKTNFKIQNGHFSDPDFSTIGKVNKTPQKKVAKQLELIEKNVYTNNLFEKIASLNAIEGQEIVNSVNNLMLFNKHFILNGEMYSPSSGESSMILLHNELQEDKEIYLIDEPEKSLGNDYINDVIVPLLKDRAKIGKIVIIATHDANIAVRTLPYNSIYRSHDQGNYYTYTGNPFSNSLKCTYGDKEDLDWKEISMKTLEGGRDAFGERGKIYGNL
ncbi:hypothetical protein GUB10_15800 [Salegentibacter sp. BLCTC]|uniref:hypothetical protein n=1 Tax=Salegentibacter sp. BLCTC TaxID=2697368 RepID=UPI00187BACF5|nr:hypothetical protein [Salegentibacter sp. BLCTC]MBE7641794.1 hypothetical protein [Salegentibacter sp. BLCTC]